MIVRIACRSLTTTEMHCTTCTATVSRNDCASGTSRPGRPSTPMPATGRTLEYVAQRARRPQVSPCPRTCRSNMDQRAHDGTRRSNARRLVSEQLPDGKHDHKDQNGAKSAAVVLIARAHPQGRRSVPYVPKKQDGHVRQHGRAAYRKGCRCERCRHAEASYRNEYRKAKR